ncbi:MAG: MBL fold metallo-hydrolase [Thermodesulfobacteriota bacterium]
MAAKIKSIEVGPLEVNCYLLWDSDTLEAFIIDPGGDGPLIKDEVNSLGLKVKYVVNTHGHFDHVGADGELRTFYSVPLAIHKADITLLKNASGHAEIFGIKAPPQPSPDTFLTNNALLEAGSISLKVIHTPGHTPGGVCLYNEGEGLLFSGDTLFAGSVGRTDLEGGSSEELMNSIKTRLLSLDDNVRVFPGHGPSTTIGDERRHNPFLSM